jgi:hypothetical protein
MQSWSPLKKSSLVFSIGVVLVVLSFLPFYAFLPSCAYWETRPYLADGDVLNQDIGFFAVGSYVKLNVLVDGGDGQISAQVLDIGLNNITKEGNVDGSGVFAFEVPKNDYYSLYLRNTHRTYVWEPLNNKQILVKVYYYFYNLVFLIFGVAIVALGTALIVYYQRKSSTTRS